MSETTNGDPKIKPCPLCKQKDEHIQKLEAILQEYREGNKEMHEFNRKLSAQIHAELIPAQKRIKELETNLKRLREEREFIRTGKRK